MEKFLSQWTKRAVWIVLFGLAFVVAKDTRADTVDEATNVVQREYTQGYLDNATRNDLLFILEEVRDAEGYESFVAQVDAFKSLVNGKTGTVIRPAAATEMRSCFDAH